VWRFGAPASRQDGQKHLQLIKIPTVDEDRALNRLDREEATPPVEFDRAQIAGFDHQYNLLYMLSTIR
jgi:hypothetical protein